MNHPLRSYLEKHQLTPRAFAVFNDLSLETVKGFMYGKCRKVPTSVKKALSSYRVDTNLLEQEYSDWLKWRAHRDVLELRECKNQKQMEGINYEK